MSVSAYWAKEIRQADRRSPKEGATRRMDRLRSQLGHLDPAIANRAWCDIGDALQKITERYTR
ncbi:MAG TPA: hypothetical protein DD420_25015 [Streptomyces sp.]|nr:hypothetical protein [Streptomyces sp.]